MLFIENIEFLENAYKVFVYTLNELSVLNYFEFHKVIITLITDVLDQRGRILTFWLYSITGIFK